MLQAVEESTQQALETVNRADVAAMAVSGQQHGMVALDASGSVIRNAKLWCDVESAPQAETITNKLGYKVVPGFTATKMLWMAENEPENWDATQHVLLPSQYMNYFLTGNMAMEARHPLLTANKSSNKQLLARPMRCGPVLVLLFRMSS